MSTSVDSQIKESTQGNIVVSEPSSLVRVLPFALPLPQSALHGWDEPILEDKEQVLPPTGIGGEVVVVGTITMMKQSAIIWFGWGKIQPGGNGDKKESEATTNIVGKGVPSMGPLVVAMPRTNYKGAFSSGGANNNQGESSCSQLIGGDSEDQLIGWQMASRLSQRVGHPVFVSCSLTTSMTGMESLATGLDRNSLCSRTAALTEREIGRLLGKYSQQQTTP